MKRIGLGIALVVATIAAYTKLKQPPSAPAVPPPPPLKKDAGTPPPAAYSEFPELNLADKERYYQTWYHGVEGSEVFPYFLLRTLKAEDGKPFMENLSRFGLLNDPQNELGLPVGMTIALPKDVHWAGVRFIGFNCAACHTAEFKTESKTVRVLGAPGRFDIREFFVKLGEAFTRQWKTLAGKQELYKALRAERKDPESSDGNEAMPDLPGSESAALDHVSESKIDQDDPLRINLAGTLTSKETPHEASKEMVRLIRARIKFMGVVRDSQRFGYTPAGPGRVDAVTTAINLIDPDAHLQMNSPVSYPHLWKIYERRLVHWDNSTNSIMERNIAQAVGLGAVYDKTSYASTLLPKEIYKLEKLLEQMRPPPWPFGKLDQDAKSRGELVFAKEKCRDCHENVEARDHTWPPDGEPPGTDPQRLDNMTEVGVRELALTVARIKEKAYTHLKPAEQHDIDRNGKYAEWHVSKGYGARSLAGVWATAPYLHNNSVPSLAALLERCEGEPRKEPLVCNRPREFTLDGGLYDVDKVGLKMVPPRAGLFTFDTDDRQEKNVGNSNVGHNYGTDLKPDEKKDLLEYLKSL